MAFDYKKEYKEFYMPKNKPGIIEIPQMNVTRERIRSKVSLSMSCRPLKGSGGRKTQRDLIMQEKKICTLFP